MQQGIWICRDEKGDKLYSQWIIEPVLHRGEWVPDQPTAGRQACVTISESFAVAILGRRLKAGSIEFRPLQGTALHPGAVVV